MRLPSCRVITNWVVRARPGELGPIHSSLISVTNQRSAARERITPTLAIGIPPVLVLNLDAYPLFQVLRDLHHQTSLQSGRLGAARGRVASGRRIAVRNGQFPRPMATECRPPARRRSGSFGFLPVRFGEVPDLFRQILDRKVIALFQSAQIEEMQVGWIAIDELGWVAWRNPPARPISVPFKVKSIFCLEIKFLPRKFVKRGGTPRPTAIER